ncbi:aromatic prenyltransferase [Cyathus striatus]|nr:aromatic prenyltransferase [Cyathus striatus]
MQPIIQNADVTFWRSLVLGQLKVLLDNSPSYNPERTQGCLDLMNKHVVGALGPQPTSSLAPWKSYLTDDHSPIEYSLSIKKGACVVRLAIEPVSSASGTPIDPVNSIAPSRWLSGFKNGDGGDMEWFTKLSNRLTISAQNNSPLHPSSCGLTQYVFALDLNENPMLKAYIFHDALARQVSSSPSEWGKQKNMALTEALTSIGLERPWKKVVTYLDTLSETNPEGSGQAEFISWDVVEPKKARMKIYVRFSKADLPQLLSHLDLGGTLDKTKQHTREIQSAATELWNIFSREDGDSNLVTHDINDQSARTHGVILYYELKLGSDEPVAKFYLPIRHYFASDLRIAERFDAFLANKKIAAPGWYTSLLSSYCNHRSLDSRTGLQTMLGCAVRGGEWELSMYISGEAFAPERWQESRRLGMISPSSSFNQL